MVKHAAAMRLSAAMVSQRPIGGRDRDSVTIIDAGTTNRTNTGASITRRVLPDPRNDSEHVAARAQARTSLQLKAPPLSSPLFISAFAISGGQGAWHGPMQVITDLDELIGR
jgi:hypothetical protein